MDSFVIDLIQGMGYSSVIYLTDCSGSPRNLSGFYVTGDIRTQYGAPSTGYFNGVVIPPYSGGQIGISLTSGDTAAFPATQLLYRVTAISYTEQIPVLFGLLNVYPQI